MDSKQPNPPRTTASAWWIITAVSVLAIFVPLLFDIEKNTGLILVMVAGILLAIIGLIVAIVYQIRAAKLDSILKGDNLLARWTYSSGEWQQYADEEYERQKSNNTKTFLIVSAISIVLTLAFGFIRRISWPLLFAVLAGAIALIGFVVWITTIYNHRQNKNIQGQAYFTPDAVYLNRQLHDFKGMGAKLEKTELKDEQQQYIEFTYSVPSRYSRQYHQVRVPVPHGKEQEARKLVEKYNSPQ
jgi:anaerobic selenocysteine-containing dehydrogenase